MTEQKVRDAEHSEDGQRQQTGLIDVDVHEMLKAGVQDLVPYLDDPWRSRIEAPDGWKGIPNLPYSWPFVGGVAKADASIPDGGPAGSSYELTKEQLLDEYDYEHAILVSMFYPTDIPVQFEFATALASAYNDWLIENWLEKDERLRGSVSIAAQQPEEAAREIDRVGSHPQIVQVILPASSRYVFGSSFYHPIFEAAVRNNLTIAIHQSYATETAVGLPHFYIEWHTAIYQTWQCQVIGLISHGVFDKYPDLRVSLLESSWSWMPSLMWRFDYNYDSTRREIPWVKRTPSEYIRDHIRISTQPMEYSADPDQLYRMFEMIGSDEILLFSSDYPHWDFDSPTHSIPRSFPKEVKNKILYENARKWYDF